MTLTFLHITKDLEINNNCISKISYGMSYKFTNVILLKSRTLIKSTIYKFIKYIIRNLTQDRKCPGDLAQYIVYLPMYT